MKLTEKNFVFTTKIDIDEDCYIIAREPTMIEFKKFDAEAKSAEQLDAARKIFPSCIIDTNLENDSGEKASGTEVWKAIEPSASLATRILTDWLNSIPFRTDKGATASD